MVICVDPGHGGRDVGAVGPTGLYERDVNLAISFYLREELLHSGAEVIMTRTSNADGPSLQQRCDIANKAKADLFISIHCDSAKNVSAGGTTSYILAKGGKAEQFAQKIQNNLVNEIKLQNRGVRTAQYYVLRNTLMPAVLVETAFISNPREEQLLRDAVFQKRIARGVNFMSKDIPDNWARPSWNWGKVNNITDGRRPKDKLTRQEMVTMLHSYHERLKKGEIK